MSDGNIEVQQGQIKMADEVISIIAGLAAMEVPGVADMSGGMVDGFAEKLRGKNLSKGVKVEVGEKEAAVSLNLIMEYGYKIPDVTKKVQDSVIKAVEGMTGLKVIEVNINIQDVHFADKEDKGEDKKIK